MRPDRLRLVDEVFLVDEAVILMRLIFCSLHDCFWALEQEQEHEQDRSRFLLDLMADDCIEDESSGGGICLTCSLLTGTAARLSKVLLNGSMLTFFELDLTLWLVRCLFE